MFQGKSLPSHPILRQVRYLPRCNDRKHREVLTNRRTDQPRRVFGFRRLAGMGPAFQSGEPGLRHRLERRLPCVSRRAPSPGRGSAANTRLVAAAVGKSLRGVRYGRCLSCGNADRRRTSPQGRAITRPAATGEASRSAGASVHSGGNSARERHGLNRNRAI